MSVSPTNAISKLTVDDDTLNYSGSTVPAAEAAGGVANGSGPQSTESATSPVSDGSATGATSRLGRKPRTVCGVCEKELSNYKCPHCPIAYCSVACSRIHRETHPADSLPPKPPQPRPGALGAPPKPTNQPPPHPFSILDNSPELRRLFKKYPNLPSTIDKVVEATLPPKASTGIIGMIEASRKRQEPWSQDVGLRRGRAALRRARMDPGEEGDGVREYCELVTYLLSRSDGANKVNAMVKREVAQEEIKLVQNLQLQEWAE